MQPAFSVDTSIVPGSVQHIYRVIYANAYFESFQTTFSSRKSLISIVFTGSDNTKVVVYVTSSTPEGGGAVIIVPQTDFSGESDNIQIC